MSVNWTPMPKPGVLVTTRHLAHTLVSFNQREIRISVPGATGFDISMKHPPMLKSVVLARIGAVWPVG